MPVVERGVSLRTVGPHPQHWSSRAPEERQAVRMKSPMALAKETGSLEQDGRNLFLRVSIKWSSWWRVIMKRGLRDTCKWESSQKFNKKNQEKRWPSRAFPGSQSALGPGKLRVCVDCSLSGAGQSRTRSVVHAPSREHTDHPCRAEASLVPKG